jgi:hypothetical protein
MWGNIHKPGARSQAGGNPRGRRRHGQQCFPCRGSRAESVAGQRFLSCAARLLRRYSWSCSAREQSGVCRFQDGLARVAGLPQLKVDQLCSVVDGTADFDPRGPGRLRLSAKQVPYIPFFALREMDRGMRGCPSGRRHSRSDARTKRGTPRQGKTSCSRNITIVRPASINAPRIAESG